MPAAPLSRRHALTLIAACVAAPVWAETTRPPQCATPVAAAGVPNLFRVTPRIYRSAQPDAEGFHALQAMGIKTVINLRRRIDDAPLAAGTELTTLHIKIKTRHVTENHGAAIVLALRALRDALRNGPVLVHCTHGADRTGMIIALWRMLYQDWPRADAITEMRQGGYGFHEVWANIPRYLEQVDLVALKSQVAAG